MSEVIKQIEKRVEEIVPASALVTKVSMMASEVIVYTRNMQLFLESEGLVKQLAGELKKRVHIRTDSSMLNDPEEAQKKIKELVPADAGIEDIGFDGEFNEVVIEAKKPGLVIGKHGSTLKSITLQTGWYPKILRVPMQPSPVMKGIRYTLLKENKDRAKFLKETAKKIYRPSKNTDWVRLTPLGGAREVGRSCFLLETPESKILLDCGINVASRDRAYPLLGSINFPIDELDAVIISHAHLDHCLPPETPVLLANGKTKPIKSIKDGDMLASIDLNTGKRTVGECIGKIKTHSHKETVVIRTPYQTIECSPNHRLFTVDGLEIKELRADEIEKGILLPTTLEETFNDNETKLIFPDYNERILLTETMREELRDAREDVGLSRTESSRNVGFGINFVQEMEGNHSCIQMNGLNAVLENYGLDREEFAEKHDVCQTVFPDRLNEECAQLVGYILGDGHASNPHSIRITDKFVPCLEHYRGLVKDIFNHESIIRHHSDNQKNAHILEINNVGIKRFLEINFDYIFNKSKHKVIPNNIMTGNRKTVTGFLRGIADAEGSVTNHVSIASSSNEVLEQLQTLLGGLGIPTNICYKDHRVLIESGVRIKRFKELVNFSHLEKRKKLQMLAEGISTKDRTNELTPLDSITLKDILEDAGVLGQINGSPKITFLPSGLLDLYRRKSGKSYATKKTFGSLIKVLEERVHQLEKMEFSVAEVRKVLSIKRTELAKEANCSVMQLTTRENKELNDEVTTRIEKVLKNKYGLTLSKTKEHISKLKKLGEMQVEWQRVVEIKRRKNGYDYLVDIEVEPTRNFIANGVVVHNSGFVPYLYQYGYKGPTYSTSPTRDLMALLQLDYVDVLKKEGIDPPYGQKDVKKTMKYVITKDYGEVTDIAPDLRLTLHNAGHILGSASAHLHIGQGVHNLLYTGDFKFGYTKMFDNIHTRYPRIETMIMESTYGGPKDIMPPRYVSDKRLVQSIIRTAEKGGSVLIPVFAIGRAQEILLVIEEYAKHNSWDIPIYIDGMTREASAIHTAYPEFMRRNVKKRILHNNSPFESDIFIEVDKTKRVELADEKGSVFLSPSGMMSGGPSVEYFKNMCEDEKNKIIFVGYQGEGSLGKKIQTMGVRKQGRREIPLNIAGRTKGVEVKMEVETIEGFSGHSDRHQLVNFHKKLMPKPERVICVHGDERSCSSLGKAIGYHHRTEVNVPRNLDSLRLK